MAVIRWDGDAAGSARAIDTLKQKIAELASGTATATLKASELDKAAQRVKENISPQDRYNRKVGELAQLVATNKITMEQAAAQAMRYGQQLDRAGQIGSRAFGGAAAQLQSLAGGVISATGLVTAITQAFRDAEEAAQRAADSIYESLAAAGELQQLGPKGQAEALRISRELVGSGAVRENQRSLAVAIGANVVNAGLNADETNLLVRDLAGTKIVAAENLDAVGGNLRGLMNQFGEQDMRDVARRTRGAANLTKADFATTAREVLKFGALAKQSGLSLDEALAGYAASEETAASSEAAAEMQKSLWSQVYRRQLGGGGLDAILDRITAKIPRGGTAFDVLGDANAVIGYQDLMRNRATNRSELAQIRAGEAFGGGLPSGLMADPVYYSAELRSRAEGGAAIAEERRSAVAENLFLAMQAELNARGADRGEWEITRWGRAARLGWADLFGNETRALRGEVLQSGLTGQRLSDDLMQAIKDHLARIEQNTGRQQQQQRQRAAAVPE